MGSERIRISDGDVVVISQEALRNGKSEKSDVFDDVIDRHNN